jgi:hypothetical protein
MPDTPPPDSKDDPLIAVWVVGEIGIKESDLDTKGAIQSAQDELGPVGFQVTTAEPA